MQPYSPDRVSNKGAWYVYDYALGFIAGWGAHPLDQLQWWADEAGLGIPVEYTTTGSLASGPLFDTVDQWQMQATYANGMKMRFYDSRTAQQIGPHLPAGMGEPMVSRGDGTLFVGSKGWVSVSRGALMASSQDLRRKAKDPGPVRLPLSRNHRENFVDCVLRREQPVATLDSAIQSDIISHMGDIGTRTGATVKWDPVQATMVGSADAVAMMHRPMRAPWALS